MKKYAFGEFIREQRKKCGLSQYQLGSLLGVSDKAVSKWESDLAKPQSHLLHPLSTILGISVDELLAGKAVSDEKNRAMILEHCNLLWNKAYCSLMSRYNNMPPIEVISRYENEKLALMNSNMIQFFEVISVIFAEAEKNNSSVMLMGGIGASFIAYLLGASDINPLPAHYYCPICKTVEFVENESDGWALPKKYCSKCQALLMRDGHHLPFEVYRHSIGKNAGFGLVVGKDFYDKAKNIIVEYFSSYSVLMIKPPDDLSINIRTFIIKPMKTMCMGKSKITALPYDEYCEEVSNYPYISLIMNDEYEKYIMLRKKVNVSHKQIDYFEEETLQGFSKGNIEGFPDFGLRNLKELLKTYRVESYHDLLQIYGIAFLASACPENEKLYIEKISDFRNLMVYRDDVFHHVYDRMKKSGYYDSGLAYMIMDKARKGVYYREGVNQHTKNILSDLGCSEQFIKDLEGILYLFPKAQGVMSVKYAFILMWYKVHDPKIFEHIFIGG